MKLTEGRDEQILEPVLPIIDAHHHIWDRPGIKYMLDEWLADISAGHNIVASIYCEASTFHRAAGPAEDKALGEIEFANGIGAIGASGRYGDCRFCAGLIGQADLTRGAGLGEFLDRALALAPDRFRGVRQITLAYPDDRPFRTMPHVPPSTVLDSDSLPLALAELQKRGLSYDAAVFDPSLPRLAEIAEQFPDLTIILNHIGMAVGIGMDAAERAEVFQRWSQALKDLAKRPNVYCKIGGLGMIVWGFGFENRTAPVGYLDLAEAWGPYVRAGIDAFGPDRCMLESNYPPDGISGGYVPIWNAYKHILRDCSADEKRALFHDTAQRAYRLQLD